MKEQQKQLVTSLAQVAVDVNSKILAMSATYDELMKELLYCKNELKELKEKQDSSSKKK